MRRLSSLSTRAKVLRREIHVPGLEEDGRRRYDWEDDEKLLSRLRELSGNKTALATELGVSRQAVTKRLKRIGRDKGKSAKACLMALEALDWLRLG